MTLARMALLVAIYVSLDLSNPLMPGALTFGVQESVEARQSDRSRGETEALPTRLPGTDRVAPPVKSVALFRPPAPVTVRARQTHVTRSHPSTPKPSSPFEDD